MLPATKTTPKELLNVYDRPALQFAIDEAIQLGVERIVVVIHPDKTGIREYLTPDPAYIAALWARGKGLLGDALTDVEIPDRIEVVFAEQQDPLGLGHAILCAEAMVLPGPVAVILPDDLILGTPCLPEMAGSYVEGHMIAAMDVQPEDAGSYGIFRVAQQSIGRLQRVTGIVEKPGPGLAPSRLAAVGRYILDPRIFDTLRLVPRGAGGEIQLTDAVARDVDTIPLSAFRFSGKRYDCGTHDGLMDAALACQALSREGARQADPSMRSSAEDARNRPG